eukprot:scaffold7.g3460.t1
MGQQGPEIEELEEVHLFAPVDGVDGGRGGQRQAPAPWWRRLPRVRLPAWLGSSEHAFQRLEEEGAAADWREAGAEASAAGHRHTPGRPPGRWVPDANAGLVSRVLFNWVGGLLGLGYSKSLEMEDLWDTAPQDEVAEVSSAFLWHLHGTAREDAPQGEVWRAMWRAHGGAFIRAGAWKLLHDVVMFLGPFLLELLLRHLQADGGGGWAGLGLATALAAASIVETLTVGLVDMLFSKALRVDAAAHSELGAGSIVNLQSNDAAKLWSLPQYLHMIWSGPFQILAVMGLLVRIIHWAPALAALGVTAMLIPATTMVARALARVRKELIAFTDARVKLCTEVITGIKAIKLLAGFLAYALLGYPLTASVAFPALSLFNLLRFPVMMFPQQIQNIINAKVALDRIQRFVEAPETEQPPALPPARPPQPAVGLRRASFAWGEGPAPLSGADLEVPAGWLVIVVGAVGAGKSSLLAALLGEMRRVEGAAVVRGRAAYTQQDPWIQNATLRDNVLMGLPLRQERYEAALSACALGPDLEQLPAGDETEIGEKGVNLSGGQRHRVALARACYADADVYLLDDPLSAVDAHVGRHLCLCGMLAGKTRILVTHQLQYLGSADWVVVVRDGQLAEQGTYQALVARGVDFHQFELSDGEEEDSAALERAEGSSELDGGELGAAAPTVEASAPRGGTGGANSGEESGAGGATAAAAERPRTPPARREGASSSAALEPEANGAAQTNGEAAAAGAGAEPGGAGAQLAQANGTIGKVLSQQSAYTYTPPPKPVMAPTQRDLPVGRLTKAEERAVGRVDRGVYLSYFRRVFVRGVVVKIWSVACLCKQRAWGPALWVPAGVLALAVVERGLQALQNWWLSVWSEATAAAQDNAGDVATLYYLLVYFGMGAASLGFQACKAVALVLGSVQAARALQDNLLQRTVRLPMSFFDSQPTGRLLNRFTRDTEAVDTSIAGSVNSFLNCFVSVLWSLVVVVAVTPAILLAIVPLTLAYARIQARYIATSRELKRLDSLAMSPLFAHFTETLAGLATVRAFRKQPFFEARNAALLDASNRAYWPMQCVNRWLSVRLELLGIAVVFGSAVFVAVAMPRSAGLAGLALTSALNLTGLMNWGVRMTTELEVNMNSVERVLEYDAQKPEAPAVVPGHRPPPGWPQEGAIKVERLVVRYRPELDPVLRGLSFEVRGREKVGVAGRTGCGKSTLMMALYRIVEPSGGCILIDGLNTRAIGLRDLRSRLALDPVVFSGTVRSNVDPLDEAGGDGRIWGALQQAGLAAAVRALPGGLDAAVAEGGGNLSVGQRQLLCMARALLRAARVLVLDEATSNVDTQATIASAFAGCTVLTIAHRLHTILDSDRVLVLEAGALREFDSPDRLLQQRGSAFRAMVEETTRHQASGAAAGGAGAPPARTKSAKQLATALRRKLPPPGEPSAAAKDGGGSGGGAIE